MSDFFGHISSAPPDPILGLTAAFRTDPREKKVNLSVGIYKTEDQKTPVLSCVKQAEARILEAEKTKDYLPIDGDPVYLDLVGQLVFGAELFPKISSRLCSVQCLGGTGGLRVGADFIGQEIVRSIHISEPSWPNHRGVFSQSGLQVHSYPYYDFSQNEVAFDRMLEALSLLPSPSVIVFHANCHNPSGADLTQEQWETLCHLCLNKGLIPFFDAAYLGFAHGFEEDAWPIRFFAKQGVEFLLSVSFSKNFSLYSERVGALFLHTKEASKASVLSKMKVIVRRNYSNPPLHGAKILAEILQTTDLKKVWESELREMRERVHRMRASFVALLCSKSKKKDYSYLHSKMGLFSFCNLKEGQVETLKREYGIYMTSDGRVNIAGLNAGNLEYVVNALIAVEE